MENKTFSQTVTHENKTGKAVLGKMVFKAISFTSQNKKGETLQLIHNQMIFDALNEELNKERLWEWSRITTTRHIQVPKVMARCRDKVLENAANLCGFIHDKEKEEEEEEEEDMLDTQRMGSSITGINEQMAIQLDQSYLNQIREDRMNRMLALEVHLYII